MSGGVSALMEEYSRSTETDHLMWREDVAVNRAWAGELARIGVFSDAELERIRTALEAIAREFESGEFVFLPSDEDIHVAVERRLTELAGEAGARIHTGRSRNDQVATDARLWIRRMGADWREALLALQTTLLNRAQEHLDTVLPGYTHWQQAQPILLAHYLLAIFWSVDRTLQRLDEYLARFDECPLGSGALAGSAFPIDRERLAQELGFARPTPNSLDATGDREVFAELLFIISTAATLFSRVCGELQVWNAHEFGFVEFADAHATGSSMMPQKKNPDAMELIRGKAAAAIAAAAQIQILTKGLPLTYNRDLQEDKPVTFRTLREIILTTRLFDEALAGADFKRERMAAALDDNLLATDLADYLVEKGVPFRRAHEIVGQAVRRALEKKCALMQLSLQELRAFSDVFEQDVFDKVTFAASLARRNSTGGTAPEAVERQFQEARERLEKIAADEKG